MMKKTIKTTATVAIICVLALTLAGTPALGCVQQNQSIVNVTVRGNVVNYADLGGLVVSLDISASGFCKALVGFGVMQDEMCGKSTFVISGSICGNILEFSGWIVRNVGGPGAALKGTPVSIIANLKSGELTYTFGPVTSIPGNPTFVFEGSGKVVVVR
ncbi:MAG TPA: hypothetical protein VLU95_01065 [Candidatus Acidoferrum sp.]|nr:hypothetical protein [Candidatus Acidoferrum sp.]